MRESLPTFIIIGASKSGTTSLSRYLGLHPDVFMCCPKEPDFFHPKRGWPRGLQWYTSLFEAGRRKAARGEASTCYTWAPRVPGVPERMARVLPEVRLIYLVRNPVERIRSMYLHFLDRGLESASFEEAIRREPLYVDSSRYGYQLDRYLEYFSRERILVLSTEQLRHARKETVRVALRFIGVDAEGPLKGLEREYQTSASKRRTPLRTLEIARVALRQSPLYRGAPRPLKNAMMSIRRALSRPLKDEDAPLPLELERYLWTLLSDDQERFRELVPADFPGWCFPDGRNCPASSRL